MSGTSVDARPALPLAAGCMESSDSVWISCRSGDFRSFYELLRGNPSLIAARDAGGHTPLHWFALANNIDAVKKILQLGAEVDSRSDNFQTPLMWAAIQGHVELCIALLEAGADIEARDSLGATALVLSVQHSKHLVLLALLDRGANPTTGDIKGASVVHWAAYKGDVTIGRILHHRGVDMYKYDGEGFNALHRGCRAGQVDFCRFLLETLDFDVDGKSKDTPGRRGQSGLEMAVECGNDDVVRLCEAYRSRKAGPSGSRFANIHWSASLERQLWIGLNALTAADYLLSVLPATSDAVTVTMFMLFGIGLLLFVYFRLQHADPGFLDPEGFLGKAVGPAQVAAAFGRRQVIPALTRGHSPSASTGDSAGPAAPGSRYPSDRLLAGTAGLEPADRMDAICFLCELVKAPRSSHCVKCDRCFERRDAHWDVLGGCVALKNHRLFISWAFLHCAVAVSFLGLALKVYASMLSRSNFAEFVGGALIGSPFLTISCAFQTVCLLKCGRILKTQYDHISTNVTLDEAANISNLRVFWEMQPGRGRAFKNPFDQGSKMDNVKEFLGMIPPKVVAPKPRALEEKV